MVNKRLTRIYSPQPLQTGHTIFLDTRASHHLLHVLRAKISEPIIVFDGQGNDFYAEIIAAKKEAQVLLKQKIPPLSESNLHIHLGQAISRGEKMDYTVQKAVELGVNTITPLFSERGGVKLSTERWENKLAHWRQIVISACEQSGRSYLPQIITPTSLSAWLQQHQDTGCKWMLAPKATQHLRETTLTNNRISLLVGPEGGFSDNEISLAEQHNFTAINLGPRVLRTETAAPAVIAGVQCLWGDMG